MDIKYGFAGVKNLKGKLILLDNMQDVVEILKIKDIDSEIRNHYTQDELSAMLYNVGRHFRLKEQIERCLDIHKEMGYSDNFEEVFLMVDAYYEDNIMKLDDVDKSFIKGQLIKNKPGRGEGIITAKVGDIITMDRNSK